MIRLSCHSPIPQFNFVVTGLVGGVLSRQGDSSVVGEVTAADKETYMIMVDLNSVSIDYRHTQDAATVTGSAAQRWRYTAYARQARGPATQIATGTAVLANLYGPDPYASLDPLGAHIRRVRDAAMDPTTRELSNTWGEDLEMHGDQLLILENLTLDITTANAALALTITDRVITQLARRAVAVLYSPHRDSEPIDDTPNLWALRAIGLNFTLACADVYYLDPSKAPTRDGNGRPVGPPGLALRASESSPAIACSA